MLSPTEQRALQVHILELRRFIIDVMDNDFDVCMFAGQETSGMEGGPSEIVGARRHASRIGHQENERI